MNDNVASSKVMECQMRGLLCTGWWWMESQSTSQNLCGSTKQNYETFKPAAALSKSEYPECKAGEESSEILELSH